MTEREPRKLLEDPAVSGRLREDLRVAKAHGALPYDAAVGLELLRASWDAGATAGAVGGANEAGGALGSGAAGVLGGVAASGVKWFAALALATGAASGAWLSVRDEPRPAALSEPRAPTQAHGVVSGRAAVAERTNDQPRPAAGAPSEQTLAAPSVMDRADGASLRADQNRSTLGTRHRAPAQAAASRSSAVERSRTPAGESVAAVTTDPPPPPAAPNTPAAVESGRDGTDEVRHLARTRRALQSDPGEALELARQGQRVFAGGTFGQERAALIVFALQALGRFDEARNEGQRFLTAHPRSPFAARIRGIVSGDAKGAP